MAGILNADGASQLFSSMLYLAKTMTNGTIKIGSRIPDPDKGIIAFNDRLDVDTFILGAADSPVQEVP